MDLHYIVDQLNAPPFQYNLSLLSLRYSSRNKATDVQQGVSLNFAIPIHSRSEKSSQECLQLLSDVFAQISPKQKAGGIPHFALPWIL